VRPILAAMSARKADSAKVLYTADRGALENDEIFVEFITGSRDAFVIEDADHLLMARANGTSICTASWPLRMARFVRRSLSRRSPATVRALLITMRSHAGP
jgi:hypothetical protein